MQWHCFKTKLPNLWFQIWPLKILAFLPSGIAFHALATRKYYSRHVISNIPYHSFYWVFIKYPIERVRMCKKVEIVIAVGSLKSQHPWTKVQKTAFLNSFYRR
jgi:hypothetical protein